MDILEIRKLQRRLGTISIYVTHDQVEAMTLGDRLMVLNGGHVAQFVSPIDLHERPATRFVAGFIGSPAMNFLDARAGPNGLSLPDDATPDCRIAASGSVCLTFPPEHVRLGSGTVVIETGLTEQLGSTTLVHGTLQGRTASATASLTGIRQIADGRPLAFDIPPAETHLFEHESGRRLETI